MADIHLTETDLEEVYASLGQEPENTIKPACFSVNPQHGVIDVRSPSEYRAGHIPNAINVPLFNDDQRAEIGTTYKKQGSDQAISLGFKIVTHRLPEIINGLEKAFTQLSLNQDDSGPIIHCWRGGMRSRSVKWLCGELGVKVSVLEGGYKGYRGYCLEQLALNRHLVVLAGPTGCGKTKILHDLSNHGEQVLDLEGLARHRGSVFGGFPGIEQPTVEQFQNEVFNVWTHFDEQRVIWLEGESQMIGRAVIPEPLWHQLVKAPMIFVEASTESRAEFLLEDYGSRDLETMLSATERIKKRLGGLRYREAVDALGDQDWKQFCMIMLKYYDKYYLKALEKRAPSVLRRVELAEPGVLRNRASLIELAKELAFSRR